MSRRPAATVEDRHEVLAQLLPDERKVIAAIARCDGIRPEEFTVQDINFFLEQARHTGELAERYADEADEGNPGL
jgi:hypothetical protein